MAGAGLALVLNADVVVAARSTRFLAAYAAVGLTPDCGVSHLLPRAVGVTRALDLALIGRSLAADGARDWGFVSEVVPDDTAHERALELAVSLAQRPAWALGQAPHPGLPRGQSSGERRRRGHPYRRGPGHQGVRAAPVSVPILLKFSPTPSSPGENVTCAAPSMTTTLPVTCADLLEREIKVYRGSPTQGITITTSKD